ncbi:MAG: response regulator transcription factor [Lachnospiraceae bacterium]|nr:response regulator transcription factor [Lachnospiraceae bacterium]
MIWCVEDDSRIREIAIYALKSAGFEVKGFEDGRAFWEALKLEKPKLILLDIMLPGIDGIELLEKIKESTEYSDIPVIMATAKGEEYDRIRGLELGADDYIVKPYSVMEMISRVKAVLRRSNPKTEANVLKYNDLIVNIDAYTVTVDGERIQLTYKEFELLCIFLARPGRVFSREQLYTQVWNMDYLEDSRTLDMHIKTLRQKLGNYGKLIETIRNVGYRLEVEDVK